MKKFSKFICGVASMAAVAFGAYCVYKNVISKDEDDFDDFDDCFDDEAAEDVEENREYVSINITEEENASEEKAEKTETPEPVHVDNEDDFPFEVSDENE